MLSQGNQIICRNRSLVISTLLMEHIPTICNTQSMSRNNFAIRIIFPKDSYVYGISIVVFFDGNFDYEVALLNSSGIIYDSSIGYEDVRLFPSAEALIYEVIRLSTV